MLSSQLMNCLEKNRRCVTKNELWVLKTHTRLSLSPPFSLSISSPPPSLSLLCSQFVELLATIPAPCMSVSCQDDHGQPETVSKSLIKHFLFKELPLSCCLFIAINSTWDSSWYQEVVYCFNWPGYTFCWWNLEDFGLDKSMEVFVLIDNHLECQACGVFPSRDLMQNLFSAQKAGEDAFSSLATFRQSVWPKTFQHQTFL